MKILGNYKDDKQLEVLKELIGKRICFARTSNLSANIADNTCVASFIQMPFFWKDEFGNESSKIFNLSARWHEDIETHIDYYELNFSIADHKKFTGDLMKEANRYHKSGLNSSITFREFEIDKIQILSRNEVVDNEAELKYDEAILLVDKRDSKILLSTELSITDEIEFITDSTTIDLRIEELFVRKTF